MQRVLKGDGLILEKQGADVTPADVCEVRDFVQAQRTLTTPFDIVIQGKSDPLTSVQQQETFREWQAAGATWWIENLIGLSEVEAAARLQAGPPPLI